MGISKDQLKSELIKRELATRNIRPFIEYVFKDWRNYDYIFGEWHKEFFEALDGVLEGKVKRLIVQVGPGTGKSEIISRLLPCLYLGKYPNRKVMNVAYAQNLSQQASRESRSLVRVPAFKRLFPGFEISEDKKEAGNWETNKGGVYYSFGVGGSVTGKRFHLGIIDDPLKGRKDAESLLIRENLWDFYRADFYTRTFDENSAIVVVATRWHDDDLIGKLLKEQEAGRGDDWKLISFPALNEEGKSFFPERFSTEFYEKTQKVIGVRDFEALYQQDPIKGGGNVFTKDMFKYFAMSDINLDEFRAALHIDPAWSTKKTSDDIAIAVSLRHKITGDIYIAEMFGDTLSPSQAYSYILNLAEKWKQKCPVEFISVEKVNISKGQDEWIKGFEDHMRRQKKYYTMKYHNPVGQGRKEDRIRITLQPRLDRGALFFRSDEPENESWDKLERQLLKFPVGSHDDLPDVVTQAICTFDDMEMEDGTSNADYDKAMNEYIGSEDMEIDF